MDETEPTDSIRDLAAVFAPRAKREAEARQATPQESNEPTGLLTVTMSASWRPRRDVAPSVTKHVQRAWPWTTDTQMVSFEGSYVVDAMELFWDGLLETTRLYCEERLTTLTTPQQ